MAYGLQCWDDNGDLVLDTAGRYTRLVYSTVTSSDGSVDLPEIDGHETAQFGEALAEFSFGPVVTRSGTTISWENRTEDESLILVFLYT